MSANALQQDSRAGESRPTSNSAVLAALSIPTLMSSLDTSIANVTLPSLAGAFGASFAQVQWVVLAYLLAITSLIVGAGSLGDALGRRRTLLAGVALFTVASAACGFAGSLEVLVAARAAQGLGAAAMMALSLAFVGDVVPKERTGRAMGQLATLSAIGTALGPSLGGALIALLGWRAVFLVNLPIGVVSLALVARHLPVDAARAGAQGRAFDWPGATLLALALAAYSFAATGGGTHAAPVTLALLVAAAAAGALFVYTEARSDRPMVRLDLFRPRALGANLAASALVSTVLMATLVVGPFYLARALGLGAARVGLVLSLGPVIVALSGEPAGRAVDRFGAGRVAAAGLAGLAAGALLLALLPASLGPGGWMAAIALLTASYAAFQTANNTQVMTARPAGERGVVSGVLSLSRNLGLVTGASVMGTVFAVASAASHPGTAAPAAIAFGMRATFAVGAALMVVALAITAANRSRDSRAPSACPRPGAGSNVSGGARTSRAPQEHTTHPDPAPAATDVHPTPSFGGIPS